MFIADLQNILSEFTDGKKGNAIKHARNNVSLNHSHLAEIKNIEVQSNNIIRAKNNGVIGVWSKEQRCIGPNIIKENMKICFLND